MGSGLYSHTTRAVGITLTANIYNGDHVNHITNHNTTQMDDYSTNVAQMQTVTDPYLGDSESLATSLAGEVERLRFQIEEMADALNPSTSQWYHNIGRIRSTVLQLEPGAVPGTNINVTEVSSSSRMFNSPTITDATNLAKSGTSGSFTLNAGGTLITMDITEDVTGILCTAIQVHDINSSSTTELYTPWASSASNNLGISLIKRASQSTIDLTTILDAGDKCEMIITFMTAT